jgi:Glutathione S-transferase, N-terminal domain
MRSPRDVDVTLYALVASHPCVAVELMLRREGLAFRRVELPILLSRPLLRAVGFAAETVPAMRLGDQRVQGSRAIASSFPSPRLTSSRRMAAS